jgi:hypothetical protein
MNWRSNFLLFLILFLELRAVNNFDNILLIINFNHAHYENIEVLKKLYGTYFKHIIFYGPRASSQVYYSEHHEGWYSYLNLAQTMQNFPNFQGYLWLHDDCILNMWQLKKLSKNKIWLAQPWAGLDLTKQLIAPLQTNWTWSRNAKAYPRAIIESIQMWRWWPMDCGYSAIEKVYQLLEPKYLTMLKKLHNTSILIGYADLVYIPAQYNTEYIYLSNLMAQHNVFLEIALPTICACLQELSQCEILKGSEFGGKLHYSVFSHFTHPIKLSIKENRDALLRIFEYQKNK